ncbi:MAG: fumarylacetoacetate hydrolase family protein [Oceanicoccus sp.]
MKLRLLFISLLLLAFIFVGFTYYTSRSTFDERRGIFKPKIVDRAQALTFARSDSALILVISHEGDAITGIDLTTAYNIPSSIGLIDWLSEVDRNELTTLSGPQVSIALDELLQPVNYTFPYIAAGTNFKDHAEEVYLDDPPFLFPKLSHAGNWRDVVPFTPKLDYEAELCVFPLADIEAGDLEQLPEFGLVLCNDFTDRWTLVKELDLGRPMGLTGFAAAKGCIGCFPTGYLVVIPKSPEFYLSLELQLFVDDELRQRFNMEDVILPVEAIIRQSFEKKDDRYLNGDSTVELLPSGIIPSGTLILTGTAGGVIFKPVNIWNQGFYLEAGDRVRTEASFLGHLENRVSRSE